MTEELELAYLAGFFDGEGTIIICKDKSRLGNVNYRLRVGASQVIPAPITMLQDKFGGLTQIHKKSSLSHRDIFTWQLHSQKAKEFLKCLLPYLTVKRDQAMFAITWVDQNKKFKGKKKTENDLIWLEAQKEELSRMKGYAKNNII